MVGVVTVLAFYGLRVSWSTAVDRLCGALGRTSNYFEASLIHSIAALVSLSRNFNLVYHVTLLVKSPANRLVRPLTLVSLCRILHDEQGRTTVLLQSTTSTVSNRYTIHQATRSSMPPEANPPDEHPSRLMQLFHSDKHKQGSSTDTAPSRPETPSEHGGSKFNTKKALHYTGMVLDALKVVSNASSLLGPLGTTCDALKVVVTTAEVRARSPYSANVLIGLYQGMVKNDEDLKGLLDKLHQQLDFIQDKTQSLTDSRFRPSHNSIHGLVKSLEAYILFVVILNTDWSLIVHPGIWIRFKTSSSY
jgi:hypothetical protein